MEKFRKDERDDTKIYMKEKTAMQDEELKDEKSDRKKWTQHRHK